MTPVRLTTIAILAFSYAVVSGSLAAYALAALMAVWMVAALFLG